MTDEGVEIMLAVERRKGSLLTHKELEALIEEFERPAFCTVCDTPIIPREGETTLRAVDRHLREHPESHGDRRGKKRRRAAPLGR